MRRKTSAPKSARMGTLYTSDKTSPQYHLEDEAAADVGEEQRDESGERPTQRSAPAPAVEIAAGEQRGENEPGRDREHRLVVELHRPAEERLRERDSGRERERQEREAREDHAEQQPLHGEQ